jgi:hypothetical protein
MKCLCNRRSIVFVAKSHSEIQLTNRGTSYNLLAKSIELIVAQFWLTSEPGNIGQPPVEILV